MEIQTKFSIGDIVFVPVPHANPDITCPLCEGKTFLLLADGRRLACSRCSREGVVPGLSTYRVFPLRVSEIHLSAYDNGWMDINYRMDERPDPDRRWRAARHATRIREDGGIFATEAEAVVAAERMQREMAQSGHGPDLWEILEDDE